MAEPATDSASRDGSTAPAAKHGTGLMVLGVAALGVVYGDLGTSPLYTIKECFGPGYGLVPNHGNVLGILSLVFWSLVIIVMVKYLTFIMHADNRGEGGTFALLALLRATNRPRSRLMALGLFGAALLYGDGVITPAISVLSAVEGLEVAAPSLTPWVSLITVAILAGLFLVQRHGTAGLGAVFGPVMLGWFASIAAASVPWIVRQPSVLFALDPSHALRFVFTHGRHGFFVLGAVVLCVTGSEALYADMGHFGRRPIRVTWYAVVFPALVLNYLGQGAVLLASCDGPQGTAADACRLAVASPFYALVPEILLYPMILIATCAAVIASQAMISGAFSLTQQAVQLGFLPRVKIIHTSAATEGQIFVPVVNTMLMIACVAIVLVARTSSNLAAAYGIAVTGTFASTSILFYAVARHHWGWPPLRAAGLTALFLAVDLPFFSANLTKLLHGGWFPMVAALGVFLVMTTWRAGARWRYGELSKVRIKFEDFFTSLKLQPPARVKGTAVFMTQDPEGTPMALLHQLKHNQVLHEQIVLLTVVTVNEPMVAEADRVQVEQLHAGFWRVLARYGFMETPNVPEVMKLAAGQGLAIYRGRTSYFLGRETFIPTGRSHMPRWRRALFAFLARNARSPTEFFGIPANEVVELGAQIEI
ncbi:MAG: potassium transporter Kup [Polyangiaceae bacterium UTPRO1]|jgi:KUP system potassium uptake protein|nr:potassium transporter Kup [Myxococcales bacterium]OQY69241.1 MAG: potassium transporter Kup [Polyangiaceae bacterium UTPRO1]